MDYDCIVFDTAPTGHTLRLLQFPSTLEKGLSKIMQLRGSLGGALNQIGALLGTNIEEMQNQLVGRLEELKVCTAEHLSKANALLTALYMHFLPCPLLPSFLTLLCIIATVLHCSAAFYLIVML